MNWELTSLWAYFDNRERNSIIEYSKEYGKLSLEEREQADSLMRNRIVGHLSQLAENKEHIQRAAVTVIDDIYRSVNMAYSFDENTLNYLGATARVAMRFFSQCGVQIHYCTNNTFSDFLRPFSAFEIFFGAAGIVYICPQSIAWKLMQHDKGDIPMDNFVLYYKDYIEESVGIADDIRSRCVENGMHYIHLDIDGGNESFEKDMQFCEKPGHLVIFRDEPPIDKSTVTTVMFE